MKKKITWPNCDQKEAEKVFRVFNGAFVLLSELRKKELHCI